jgi:hypothetical protein
LADEAGLKARVRASTASSPFETIAGASAGAKKGKRPMKDGEKVAGVIVANTEFVLALPKAA